jgi:DNA modification methylase
VKATDIKPGQMLKLGEHRLLCGDATKQEDVERLMGGKRADMIFTDPPYGIGKSIKNDNLKGERWLKFYEEFTNLMLNHLKTNGYFYVWGYFETLSNYWENIIKPRGDSAFRNFIIWVKSFVQGLRSSKFRQFPEQYGACLLCIKGQIFNNGEWSLSPNAEYFPEMFEPLRKYLDDERRKMGWDIPTVKRMVGHSDLAGDHWFSKSQWSLPTKKVYEILQKNAKGKAFLRNYDEQYCGYEGLCKEYNKLREYFDNSLGYTDVWQLRNGLTTTNLHPTVKPVELCEMGVISTSKEGEIVLDLFGGSGSTMIACEKLGRRCFMMEIEPMYCEVIANRWENLTGKQRELTDEAEEETKAKELELVEVL